jgi:transposase-like protein
MRENESPSEQESRIKWWRRVIARQQSTPVPPEQESRIKWWRRVIARQQSTPVPLTEFCRQMGINPRKFYYWRKRLREMDAASSGPPIITSGSLRSASTLAREAAVNFLPVSIIGRNTAIDIGRSTTTELEIELANGSVVRLKGAVDGDLLQIAINATGEISGRGDH